MEIRKVLEKVLNELGVEYKEDGYNRVCIKDLFCVIVNEDKGVIEIKDIGEDRWKNVKREKTLKEIIEYNIYFKERELKKEERKKALKEKLNALKDEYNIFGSKNGYVLELKDYSKDFFEIRVSLKENGVDVKVNFKGEFGLDDFDKIEFAKNELKRVMDLLNN